jgi:hypothetical protein
MERLRPGSSKASAGLERGHRLVGDGTVGRPSPVSSHPQGLIRREGAKGAAGSWRPEIGPGGVSSDSLNERNNASVTT